MIMKKCRRKINISLSLVFILGRLSKDLVSYKNIFLCVIVHTCITYLWKYFLCNKLGIFLYDESAKYKGNVFMSFAKLNIKCILREASIIRF